MRVTHSEIKHRGEIYEFVTVKAGAAEVQVSESPTGRSVQVHVLANGEWRKVHP